MQKQRAHDEKRISDLEWKLIKKSIAIAGIFASTWVIYVLITFYELVTLRTIPLWIDYVWETVCTMTPILNCIILYTYDGKVRSNVRELLHAETVEEILGKRWRNCKRWLARILKRRGNHHSNQEIPNEENICQVNGNPILLLHLNQGGAGTTQLDTVITPMHPGRPPPTTPVT